VIRRKWSPPRRRRRRTTAALATFAATVDDLAARYRPGPLVDSGSSVLSFLRMQTTETLDLTSNEERLPMRLSQEL
jgi:hypothetical protein